MIKRAAPFLLFIIFAAGIFGCETAKGAAKGAQADFQTASRGTANCWQALLKADDWMRENLW